MVMIAGLADGTWLVFAGTIASWSVDPRYGKRRAVDVIVYVSRQDKRRR